MSKQMLGEVIVQQRQEYVSQDVSITTCGNFKCSSRHSCKEDTKINHCRGRYLSYIWT